MIGTEMGKIAKEFEVRTKSKVLKENRIVVVNEGYRAAVAKNGKLSEPEEIDLSNLDRGWEK